MNRNRNFAAWPILLATMAATGCQRSGAELQMQSVDGQRVMSVQFTRVYASQDKMGAYEALLVSDGIAPDREKSSGPIESTAVAPLQQVIQIRVFWQPPRGLKPDAPATN
ncbi:MAG: hypothetical protein ACREJC_10050, partial [Tepidisphaeraceae bacterium]